jgi:soluble lytic murein transglycosylase
MGVILVFIALSIFCVYSLYPQRYKEIVYEYAKRYDVDPFLVYAIMKVESKYDTLAISRSGAKGLMQIMDKTGAWGASQVSIKDYTHDVLFKPEVNVQIGCWYISKLIRQYEGNMSMALAAYNAGTGNIAKWCHDPKYSLDGKTLYEIPFKETRAYVQKVKWHYTMYKVLYRD